jgi:hypothetical protein
VLIAVSTSRLSCKRAGKTRTLMPVWDSHAVKTRDELAQEFESLAGKLGLQIRKAGDITARSRKAGDQAGAERVCCNREDDGDHRCRLLECGDSAPPP